MSKNYGLSGIGSDVQLGKNGARIKSNDENTLQVTSRDGSTTGAFLKVDAAPATDTDVTNKKYVDDLINGRSWKSPVVVCVDGTKVTGNYTLTTTNMVGVVIDGVTLVADDRIALFDQTSGADNGIYVVAAGAGNTLRSDDVADGDESRNFTFFSSEGTVNTDITWTITNDEGGDIVGTDDLLLAQTGSASPITAGAGLTRTGDEIDVAAADLSLTVNANDMQVNIGNTNGTSLEVSASGLELASAITGERTIGSGTTSSHQVTLDTNVDNARLTSQPSGTVPLAIATTNYVDTAISSATSANVRQANSGAAITLSTSVTDVAIGAALPAGTKPSRIKIYVDVAEVGASSAGTLSVGTAANADKYAAVGLSDLTETGLYIIDVLGTDVGEQLTYDATIATITPPTTDSQVRIEVEFVTP